MKNQVFRKLYIVGFTGFLFAGCATKKATFDASVVQSERSVAVDNAKENKAAQLKVVQKVFDQSLYQRNLVADLTVTINTGTKNITVPGILHMRKDEVVRLQLLLPLLRSEVGRIEFTKDYVLFINRMQKEYVKVSYNDVAFLKSNSINFYALQALFWNQLFLPNEARISENGLTRFHVDLNNTSLAAKNLVSLSTLAGKLNIKWLADSNEGLIKQTEAKYVSTENGTSTLTWSYQNFKPFGSKRFPMLHEVSISTTATKGRKNLKATFELGSLSDKDDWESYTTPSSKYTQVKVEDIFEKLMTF